MTARPLHHHAYTITNTLPATKGAKLLHDVVMKAHLGLDRDLTSPFGSATYIGSILTKLERFAQLGARDRRDVTLAIGWRVASAISA